MSILFIIIVAVVAIDIVYELYSSSSIEEVNNRIYGCRQNIFTMDLRIIDAII